MYNRLFRYTTKARSMKEIIDELDFKMKTSTKNTFKRIRPSRDWEKIFISCKDISCKVYFLQKYICKVLLSRIYKECITLNNKETQICGSRWRFRPKCLLPCTTKRRITTNLKTKNNQNCKKIICMEIQQPRS